MDDQGACLQGCSEDSMSSWCEALRKGGGWHAVSVVFAAAASPGAVVMCNYSTSSGRLQAP